MTAVLTHVDQWLAAGQARRRPGLSPSRIHACPRQSAYLLHQVPQSDLPDTAAADLGTLIHHTWADILAAAPGYRVELALDLHGHDGPTGQTGTCDWAHLTEDGATLTIGDLKTKSDRAWQRWVSLGGPDQDVWDQLEIYAAAAAHLPTADNADTVQLEVVAANRDTGHLAHWTRPANLQRGHTLADQLATQQAELLAAPPDDAPRTGTGSNYPCDWCPWLTRCWGDTAIRPIPDIDGEQAAREYLRASAAEATARATKNKARERLIGRTVDAPDVTARWTTTTRSTLDEAELRERYGPDLPTRTTSVTRLNARWRTPRT